MSSIYLDGTSASVTKNDTSPPTLTITYQEAGGKTGTSKSAALPQAAPLACATNFQPFNTGFDIALTVNYAVDTPVIKFTVPPVGVTTLKIAVGNFANGFTAYYQYSSTGITIFVEGASVGNPGMSSITIKNNILTKWSDDTSTYIENTANPYVVNVSVDSSTAVTIIATASPQAIAVTDGVSVIRVWVTSKSGIMSTTASIGITPVNTGNTITLANKANGQALFTVRLNAKGNDKKRLYELNVAIIPGDPFTVQALDISKPYMNSKSSNFVPQAPFLLNTNNLQTFLPEFEAASKKAGYSDNLADLNDETGAQIMVSTDYVLSSLRVSKDTSEKVLPYTSRMFSMSRVSSGNDTWYALKNEEFGMLTLSNDKNQYVIQNVDQVADYPRWTFVPVDASNPERGVYLFCKLNKQTDAVAIQGAFTWTWEYKFPHDDPDQLWFYLNGAMQSYKTGTSRIVQTILPDGPYKAVITTDPSLVWKKWIFWGLFTGNANVENAFKYGSLTSGSNLFGKQIELSDTSAILSYNLNVPTLPRPLDIHAPSDYNPSNCYQTTFSLDCPKQNKGGCAIFETPAGGTVCDAAQLQMTFGDVTAAYDYLLGPCQTLYTSGVNGFTCKPLQTGTVAQCSGFSTDQLATSCAAACEIYPEACDAAKTQFCESTASMASLPDCACINLNTSPFCDPTIINSVTGKNCMTYHDWARQYNKAYPETHLEFPNCWWGACVNGALSTRAMLKTCPESYQSCVSAFEGGTVQNSSVSIDLINKCLTKKSFGARNGPEWSDSKKWAVGLLVVSILLMLICAVCIPYALARKIRE
jgi:hypothetical protein